MKLFKKFSRDRIYQLVCSDLWIFEFSVWLHSFSRSMVSVFIPILLLEIGYPIGEVILYYFLFNLFDVPLNFVARWTTRKIGARKVIILGSIFSLAFLIALYQLGPGNWLLLVFVALLAALYDTFYWVAHLYLFMRCSKNDSNVSGDTGWLSIVRGSANVVAPLAGVGILVFFGRNSLILTSAIVLALSIWPLFKIKNVLDKPRRPQLSFRRFFNNWGSFQDYLIKGFLNFHLTTESVIWPLFIFSFFGSFESVAALPIIASVAGAAFTYLASRINKRKRGRAIVLASLVVIFIWILRITVDSSIFYYASVFLVGFFVPLISIPLDSYIFEKGEEKETLSASMYRNTVHMFSNAVLFGFLALLINIFDVSFISAAAGLTVVTIVTYFSFGRRKIFSRSVTTQQS